MGVYNFHLSLFYYQPNIYKRPGPPNDGWFSAKKADAMNHASSSLCFIGSSFISLAFVSLSCFIPPTALSADIDLFYVAETYQ